MISIRTIYCNFSDGDQVIAEDIKKEQIIKIDLHRAENINFNDQIIIIYDSDKVKD